MPSLSYKVSGIYKITNTINGHCYIGSAVDVRNRWYQHTNALKKNKHENKHLQRAWNKYGAECFKFSIIETCFRFALLFREQHYINLYSPEYNISPTAGSMLGKKLSEETKRKISIAHIGMKSTPMSDEARKRMSEERKGKPKSEETKRNMSKAQKGRVISEEHRRNLSLSHIGNRQSEEAKKKISAGHLGKKKSEQTKKNMSIAQRLARLAKKGSGQ